MMKTIVAFIVFVFAITVAAGANAIDLNSTVDDYRLKGVAYYSDGSLPHVINQGRNFEVAQNVGTILNILHAFGQYNSNNSSDKGPIITRGGATQDGVNLGCQSGVVVGC